MASIFDKVSIKKAFKGDYSLSQQKFVNLSVIFPWAHDIHFLSGHFAWLNELRRLSGVEIELIFSVVDPVQVPQILIVAEALRSASTSVMVVDSTGCFPGDARNRALEKATHDWIWFLDVQTIPEEGSVATVLDACRGAGSFVRGFCNYSARSPLVRYAWPMSKQGILVHTLPGTLIRRSSFSQNLLFEADVRAGEDTVFMKKLAAEAGLTVTRSIVCQYTGIRVSSYIDLVKKWWRNYSDSELSLGLYLHLILGVIGMMLAIMATLSYGWIGVLMVLCFYSVLRLFLAVRFLGLRASDTYFLVFVFLVFGVFLRLVLDVTKFFALTRSLIKACFSRFF